MYIWCVSGFELLLSGLPSSDELTLELELELEPVPLNSFVNAGLSPYILSSKK